MKRFLFILSIIILPDGLLGQTVEYFTVMMNYQHYSNGVPDGSPIISYRKDTITITPQSISLTNYVYGTKKTSTFRITSIENNVYTCQVDEVESYKVCVKDGFVFVECFIGRDLFSLRKYLINPKRIKLPIHNYKG